MSGLYAADGSLNMTGVSGLSYTGLYAADGSLNAIAAPGNSYVGAYHPCGALYVTQAPVVTTAPNPLRAPDGSMYCSVSPYTYGGQRVTFVSGNPFNTLSAPVLSVLSVTGNSVSFAADVDNTIVAGDSLRLQIQVSGGDWSSPVYDNTHVITAPEDAANEIDLTASLPIIGNTYQARCDVTHGAATSSWSNTVSFTTTTTYIPTFYFLGF